MFRATEANRLFVDRGAKSFFDSEWFRTRSLFTLNAIGSRGSEKSREFADPWRARRLDEIRGATIFAGIPAIAARFNAAAKIQETADEIDNLELRAYYADELAKNSRIEGLTKTTLAAMGGIDLDVVGNMDGYLEDCGCKTTKAGGLKRVVDSWAHSTKSTTPRIVLGNMIAMPNMGHMRKELNEFVLKQVAEAGPAVFVPGTAELLAISIQTLSVESLLSMPAALANVRMRDSTQSPWRGWSDRKLSNGKTLRFVGFYQHCPNRVSSRYKSILDEHFEFEDISETLRRTIEETPTDHLLVLLGEFNPNDLREVLNNIERPILILSSCQHYPRHVPKGLVGSQVDGSLAGKSVHFLASGRYGLTQVAWKPDAAASHSRIHRLEQDVPSTEPIAIKISDVLESLGSDAPVELEFVEPLLSFGARYVGNQVCQECHPKEVGHWLSTPHARAFKTLEKTQRHRSAVCVACHVVGYGQPSGYEIREDQFTLQGVGCEVCHGPGSLHASDPTASKFIRRLPATSLCANCHSVEHSSFLNGQQEKYMGQVKHK